MTLRFLIPVLLSAVSALAQKTDTAEISQEHGFPWIAHSSIDVFYLNSPAVTGQPYPYQASLYQGFTIQSLTFAWFHIGLRSRETQAPGFSQPYREPLALKLQASAEVLRDYLFVSFGGNIPIFGDTIALADSLALYQAMNGYSPMPFSSFLSPRALQAAVFGRYAWTNWTLIGGFGYSRPALFRLIKDKAFFPASYFDFSGRAIYQARAARHRWDAKASIYGDEGNDIRIPAHNEGDLYQFRYEYLKSLRRVAWQTGLGAAIKLPDANRRLKLKSDLEAPDTDDNLQRAYLEMSVAWAPDPDILWRLHVAPRAIFSWNGTAVGHETEAGLTMGLRIWEYHRIRVAGTMLYGQVDNQTYTGFGIRGEFAFRHLGFQDIDDGAEGEGE
ncbi:MAG: hypothetical protein JWO30_2606 [Fibrobacteres bacterium]|nr:hypothetical protein [Fibrobacterota bacterium]